MGIYFIAAGNATNNRFKSLEKSFSLNELEPYLPNDQLKKLKTYFSEGDPIYLWGATENRYKQLKQVNSGEYVVDVKNKEVMNVFEYCFQYQAPDNKLQEFIGWDGGRPKDDKRSYEFVYFLKNPRKPANTSKSYFGRAFGYDSPFWLTGQKYFDNQAVQEALNRTNSKYVEEFLGIKPAKKAKPKKSPEITEEKIESKTQKKISESNKGKQSVWNEIWEWLKAFPGMR